MQLVARIINRRCNIKCFGLLTHEFLHPLSAIQRQKSSRPAWDESFTHAVPPNFPVALTSDGLIRPAAGRPLNAGTYVAASSIRRIRETTQQRFLQDHLPPAGKYRFPAPPALCYFCTSVLIPSSERYALLCTIYRNHPVNVKSQGSFMDAHRKVLRRGRPILRRSAP